MQRTGGVNAEFKLGVGNDDAAFKRVGSGFRIKLKGRRTRLLGNLRAGFACAGQDV